MHVPIPHSTKSVMFAAALVNFRSKVVDVSSSCIGGIYAYEVRRSYGAKIRRGSSGGRFIQFHKPGTTVLDDGPGRRT